MRLLRILRLLRRDSNGLARGFFPAEVLEDRHAYNIAMPFKSEAQRRYFHVMQAQGKISPETVKEWEDATPKKEKKKLPYHVGEVKKSADLVPGGLGDNASPSDFSKKQLAKGRKVELEHTDNPALAQEIAKDHLTEDPRYYTHLAKMEKAAAAIRGKMVGKADASARQYSLREDPSGKMTCTCGDYKFRQAGVNGECKHIKAHRSSGARGDGVPMIRDHVKAGSEAALAKYAIEFKSPKMKSILTNAVDQAYTSGRSGRLHNKRFGFGETRPAAKMISAAYLDGRKGPLLPARFRGGTGERMPLGEELRRQIFGGNVNMTHLNYTSRTSPRAGLDGARKTHGTPGQGASKTMGALSDIRFEERPGLGEFELQLDPRLSDPRIQRVIEHHAPGGMAHIKERIRRVNAGEPVPAFNAQKLKPPGETP